LVATLASAVAAENNQRSEKYYGANGATYNGGDREPVSAVCWC
jgi:hypothetical protein